MSTTYSGFLKLIRTGLSELVFPNVCLCCGLEVTEFEKQICSFCLTERFEPANPEFSISSGDAILPEGICLQHALWKFDKGGDLQGLLHMLKYEHIAGVGRQLGRQLAYQLSRHWYLKELLESHDAVIIPVPLHYLKFIRRGYNQAYMVALGLHEILKLPVCDIKDVIRRKNTRSQTGFSLWKRRENLKGAFKVRNRQGIVGKMCLIVDDVFTTGATSFELAGTLAENGAAGSAILTLAQA